VPELEKLVRTDLSAGEIGQILNFGRGLDQAHDILSLPPNPQLTPSYTGPGGAAYINLTPAYRAAVHQLVEQPRIGGAAYINLTPAYRAAVHQLVEQPRIAAEAARVTIYNAGAPIGSGSTAAEVLRKAGLVVAGVDTSAQRVSATRIEAGDGARQTAARIAELLGVTPDALVVDGDSSSIQVLLGPDATIHVG
jgi:hypothetical protein